MNERIKELAFKAYDNAGGGTPESLSLFMEVYSEKFAELIVKECAQFVEDKFDFCGDEIIIAEAIEKHFGVK